MFVQVLLGADDSMDGGSPRQPTAALVVFSSVVGCVKGSAPTAGFWFEDASFSLPADAATTLGGPLQPRERALIERVSRAELERAFAGLRIAIVPTSRRVLARRGPAKSAAQRAIARAGESPPRAGESLALGSLGGAGGVDFTFVAILAVRYAPPGAPRQAILEGIGRGIGRVAVHELAHQILGAAAGVHDRDDGNSYEYHRPDRASRSYGELHWTIAWPHLHERLGTRVRLMV